MVALMPVVSLHCLEAKHRITERDVVIGSLREHRGALLFLLPWRHIVACYIIVIRHSDWPCRSLMSGLASCRVDYNMLITFGIGICQRNGTNLSYLGVLQRTKYEELVMDQIN
ncbi:hypothetical protein BJX63DRAFT_349033 [Aspergillus granulosus]|uniref:Uncharacterized protein n=1 Tax=Aspergillus granulosus TaxID=176169 RepID=A0ABR4H2J2_9EURO